MIKKKKVKDILKYPEADLVVNYILERKKHGLYTLLLGVGTPGSGKTSTLFRIGEKLHELGGGEGTFGASNIIDNFLDLVTFVKNADPNKLCIAVIEEVSVLFPSRRSMAQDNVDVGKVLDTCRKREVILLASAPIWTAIDSHMRALANIYIQTLKVYKKEKIVISKFFRLQTDPRSGKTYTHCFRRNGLKIKRMYTKMPGLEEWNKYENIKDTFMDALYTKVKAKAEKRIEKEKKLLPVDMGGDVRKFSPRELEYMHLKNKKNKNNTEIAQIMGVSNGRITAILKNIKKKTQNT